MASRALSFIGGGLLKGAGEGAEKAFILQAQEEKDRALLELRNAHTSDEAEKTRTHASGLLADTVQDKDGNYYGVTKGGEKKDLGIKGPRTSLKGGTAEMKNYQLATEVLGMSPANAANWVRTKKDSSRQEVKADIYKQFARGGYLEPDQIDEAVDKAMRYLYGAKPKADKSSAKPKEDDGGLLTWLKSFVGGKKEAPKTAEAAAPNATDSPVPAPRMKPMQGSGTKADPYVGTNQDQIDWFKQNARPGDVLTLNGKKYTKK